MIDFLYRIIRNFLFVASFTIIGTSVAFAAWTVFDPSAVAKLTTQINEMKKQFQELQSIKNEVKDQLAAIGEAGSLLVPITSLAKLEGQIRKTVQCSLLSKEDFETMIPGLKFEEFDVGSVCNAKSIYRKALFPTQEDFNNAATAMEKTQLGGQVRARRTVMVVDTSTKALAFADVTLKGAEEYTDAVNELEAAADTASTQNERLAVIAKGQALIGKGIAQTNQLLAMMLKQQTAHSVRDLPIVPVQIDSNTNQ